MRVVVDTNDFISALIGKKHREKLTTLLNSPDIALFADDILLTELAEVAGRDKFRQYVTPQETPLFLSAIRVRLTLISPTSIITDCIDPDDNYLLSLAVDAQADYLITGDKKYLLSLSPYRGIPIVRLQTWLNMI